MTARAPVSERFLGEAPSTPSERRPRLESVTGLRFLAALGVFGLHLDGAFYFRSSMHVLDHAVDQGAVGVSFFFILSGFVLTWSHQPGDRRRDFYQRRLARIGPLQIVTWALMAAVLVGFGPRPSFGPAFASLFLLSPWIPSTHYIEAMNVPCWSLGCELFFYALFPILLTRLVRLAPRGRRLLGLGVVGWALVAAVLCAPAASGTTRGWALYFFPPMRLPEFVLGMILALEVSQRALPRLSLAWAGLLALGTYVADSWAPSSFALIAVTIVPFCLLIVAAAQRDVSGRPNVLSTGAMVALGTWSFAFYLVHLPVLTVLGHLVEGQLDPWRTAATALAALGLSLGAAAALYRFVERPAERRLRPGRRRLAAPALATEAV